MVLSYIYRQIEALQFIGDKSATASEKESCDVGKSTFKLQCNTESPSLEYSRLSVGTVDIPPATLSPQPVRQQADTNSPKEKCNSFIAYVLKDL